MKKIAITGFVQPRSIIEYAIVVRRTSWWGTISSILAIVVFATVISGCSEPQTEVAQPRSAESSSEPRAESQGEAVQPLGEQAFVFPRVDPNHHRMIALLENAFSYIAPHHGIIDSTSGYPVEGWNHDPERGLFLRSFTQLTAIGQWIELLANIAAGEADNPYISRDEALERLSLAVKSVRHDQHDPKVSAMGLLGNFLGLEGEQRTGPLARDVAKQDVVDAFGEEKATAIWQALKDEEWIKPENNDQSGVIQRDEEYGLDYFEGALEPFGDDDTKRQLMEIMDERIVMVAYGDNANLASSVAKAIGALLTPGIRDNPAAISIERGDGTIPRRPAGRLRLPIRRAGGLAQLRLECVDRQVLSAGKICKGSGPSGHSDYLVNEFRGPTIFVLLRYAMPEAIVANLGFKIKSYRLTEWSVDSHAGPVGRLRISGARVESVHARTE